jgi:hypothetical protein
MPMKFMMTPNARKYFLFLCMEELAKLKHCLALVVG